MSLQYYYRPSWRSGESPIAFSSNVRLYTLDVSEYAEEGSVAMSTYLVDDDDGVLDFPPLTRIWAVETEAASSSNTYVHHGYIADRVIHRGDSALTSSARVWEVSVADENSVLTRRVLSSTSANRPSETDVARVQWLANEADGQLLIDDTTLISTAHPVTMDAADYRGQTGADVLRDCAEASGKNYWAYFSEGVGTGIWYGSEDLSTYSSMIRLTNVLGEVNHDQNVYEISRTQTRLTRDPSRLLSGVWMQYGSGSGVYVRNQAMFQEIGLRDMVMSAPNVTTLARAQARANRFLADLDSEEDRITTQVRLPATKVTWIKRGMRVRFKATHLPGYEEEVWLRVYRCSVAQDSEQPDSTYLLTLELGTNSIPPSPADSPAEAPPDAVISHNGHIGSAVFLGTPSDVEDSVSSGTATLQVGKQYRLVLTVISCRITDPTREYDNINSPNVRIWESPWSVGGATPVTQPNGYDWIPDDGTNTAMLTYEGAGYAFNSPIRSGGPAPNNSYAPGEVIEGDWLTFNGPSPVEVQVGLHGIPLSGFWGFEMEGNVQLQERTP